MLEPQGFSAGLFTSKHCQGPAPVADHLYLPPTHRHGVLPPHTQSPTQSHTQSHTQSPTPPHTPTVTQSHCAIAPHLPERPGCSGSSAECIDGGPAYLCEMTGGLCPIEDTQHTSRGLTSPASSLQS